MTLAWPGLDHPVVITTSEDRTARIWDPQNPAHELARFEGHTESVTRATSLPWPGLDHAVIVTTSGDRTARIWDPQNPAQELARFEGHTEGLTGVATLAWPGLDQPVVITTSNDRTARIWDPHRSDRELAVLILFGEGRFVAALDETKLAIASSRGFLVFDLSAETPVPR
jgi:WD40 repeat protein